eukprot:7056697-Pyramimonas_sp.AAC.1
MCSDIALAPRSHSFTSSSLPHRVDDHREPSSPAIPPHIALLLPVPVPRGRARSAHKAGLRAQAARAGESREGSDSCLGSKPCRLRGSAACAGGGAGRMAPSQRSVSRATALPDEMLARRRLRFCCSCGHPQCGVPGGRWSTYALRPGLSSGRYKKEMNKHLPQGGPFYLARVPASLSKAAHEHSRLVPFRQVFASVASEVNASAEIREALEHGEWDDPNSVMSLPAYCEHPHVVQCKRDTGKFALPLAVYLDGVRYTAITAGRTDHLALATTAKRHS